MSVKRWNGTTWDTYAGSDLSPVKVTDSRAGKTTWVGANTPTSPTDGDIWIDQDTATNAVVPTVFSLKGQILAGSGSASYTVQPVGTNGYSLVADSTQSTGLNWAPSVSAGKNMLINGAMDVWQRGIGPIQTSTGVGTGYTADRWQLVRDGFASNAYVSQQSPGVTLPQFRYCARVQRTSGDTSTSGVRFAQAIETAESIRFQGQTVTLSFWARSGSQLSSAVVGAYLYSSPTAVDANAATNELNQTYTAPISINFSPTSNWQLYTATGNIPTVSNQLGLRFYNMPSGTAGANDYYEITGIQLEQGPTATPFSRAGGTLAGEIIACQRYYVRFGDTGTSSGLLLSGGFQYNTVNAWFSTVAPVAMRIKPAFLDSGGTIRAVDVTNGSQNITNPALANECTSTMLAAVVTASSSFTAGRWAYLNQNSTGAYIGFSAEL